MSRYPEINLNGVTTYSVAERYSKVDRTVFAEIVDAESSFAAFWESLPRTLAAADLKELIGHLLSARGRRPILWMSGAHPLKVGLSRVLIDLLDLGFVSGVSSHGAFAVHDCEIALFGTTSEDVADSIRDGRFGMARETGEFFAQSVATAQEKELGLGEALGESLIRANAPYVRDSVLVQCLERNVPVTIHAAIGTDIVHEHGGLSGSSLGDLSYRDFRIFCELVSRLGDGGVALNIGSAVIMPEVFLKALAVVRNLGFDCHRFYTANFDMIQHYRPQQNIVRRPTSTGGRGYSFTGHHELMIPLLAAGIKIALAKSEKVQ